jgi:hypothetical protein
LPFFQLEKQRQGEEKLLKLSVSAESLMITNQQENCVQQQFKLVQPQTCKQGVVFKFKNLSPERKKPRDRSPAGNVAGGGYCGKLSKV